MNKYIFSIDIGTSNIKTIIMEINNDNIVLFDKFIIKNTGIKDFENNILMYITQKKIVRTDIEIFVLSGAGSSYYNNKFIDFDIIKIDEIDAIGFGGIILSKNEQGIVVNMGTGTTIVYSDLNESKHLSGTALGGGTFIGLCKKMNISFNNFDDLYEMGYRGNTNNVDLLISDISKDNISNMSKDVTASNFGALNKSFNEDDIVAGVLNLIAQNIGLILQFVVNSFLIKNNIENINIIFCGTFAKHKSVKKFLTFIEKYTKLKYNYIDDEYTSYTTAIGAYEYYLLKIRENIGQVK